MITIKKFHTRILISIIFLGVCVRMAFAQIWPLHNSARRLAKQAVPENVQRSLLLKLGGARADQRHYALEITGIFPFVRVVSVMNRALAAPIETAALSPMATDAFDLYSATGLMNAQQTASPDQAMLIESCSGCSGCSGCTGCSCGCTGCGGCSSCSSCFSCFGCSSCGSCFSCFY